MSTQRGGDVVNGGRATAVLIRMIYLDFLPFPSREQLPLLVPAALQKRPRSSAATFSRGAQIHERGEI